MKVVYIVNSDLGKHGSIGFRTFEVAQEAFKRGFLKRIICRGNFQDSIPKELIKFSFLHRIFSLGLEFLRMYFFNKFNSYKLNFKSFEFFVSQKMLECDVCHSYELTEKLIRSLKKESKILIYDTQMGLSIDKNDKKAITDTLSYAWENYDVTLKSFCKSARAKSLPMVTPVLISTPSRLMSSISLSRTSRGKR